MLVLTFISPLRNGVGDVSELDVNWFPLRQMSHGLPLLSYEIGGFGGDFHFRVELRRQTPMIDVVQKLNNEGHSGLVLNEIDA